MLEREADDLIVGVSIDVDSEEGVLWIEDMSVVVDGWLRGVTGGNDRVTGPEVWSVNSLEYVVAVVFSTDG